MIIYISKGEVDFNLGVQPGVRAKIMIKYKTYATIKFKNKNI